MQVQQMKFFKIKPDSIILFDNEKTDGKIFIVLSSVKSFIEEREKLTGENYCCLNSTFQDIINSTMCKVIPSICQLCESIKIGSYYLYVENKEENAYIVVCAETIAGEKMLYFHSGFNKKPLKVCDLTKDNELVELTILAHNERGMICIQ